MKNKLLNILICTIVLFSLTGCQKEETKDKNISYDKLAFTINVGRKECVPVSLAVYEDGTYELFTAYEACFPGQVCTMMLKYTNSKKGKYDYDIDKIIEASTDANELTHSMDNLPEYEIYTRDGHLYTVEKGKKNKYLVEFLKQIKVDLNTCARADYR